MGQTIEFDRVAVTFDSEQRYGGVEQHYLIVHETGVDNVLDHDGNIAHEWNYYTVGNEADVIADLARGAGDIERGYLRYQNGKTKTENFIKNWRESMRESNTLSVSEFVEKFPFAEFVIARPPTVTELPDTVREAFDTIKGEWRRTQPESRDAPVYRADISLDTLQLFETLSDETNVWIDFK